MEHSDTVEAMVKEISTAMVHFTASRFVAVAGFVVMIYDHLTTFSDEVELIWMKPINTVSMIFLINRYGVPIALAIDLYDKGGLAKHSSHAFCVAWMWAESYAQILFHAGTHALVALRVRALWGRGQFFDWFLGVSFVAYLSATIIIATIGNVPLSGEMYFSEVFHMCFADSLAHFFFWVWIPALLFEGVLFALTMIRAIQYHKRNMVMPVTRILYRDGILYFQVIAVCTIFNIVAWTALPQTLVVLAKYFSFSVVTTMGSKLVLNLRAIRKEDDFMVNQSQISTTLPNFELSQLKTSDQLRTENSFITSSHANHEQAMQRSVSFAIQHQQKTANDSYGSYNDGYQDIRKKRV
ncbi:hypothetical protein FRC02_010743, partial [Tulasnella sp. 418]